MKVNWCQFLHVDNYIVAPSGNPTDKRLCCRVVIFIVLEAQLVPLAFAIKQQLPMQFHWELYNI